MKKLRPFAVRHLIVASLFVSVFPIVSCAQTSENVTISTPAISELTLSAPDVSTPVDLKLRLKVGQVFPMRLVAEQRITQVQGATRQSLQHSVAMDWIYDVRSVAPDGSALVGCKIAAVSFHRAPREKKINDKIVDSGLPNGGAIDYDSRDISKPAPPDIEEMEALVGARFSFEMRTNGTIQRVIGLNDLSERLLTQLKVADKNRSFMRGMARSALSGSAFKNVGNLMATFPANALQIGDSWQKSDPVSRDIPLEYDTKCTLLSRENGVATIGLRSILKPRTGENAAVPMGNGFENSVQVGQMQVDENSGWTVGATVSLRGSTTQKSTKPVSHIYFLSTMTLSKIDTQTAEN